MSQNLTKSADAQAPSRDYKTQIQVLLSFQVMPPILEQMQFGICTISYNTLRTIL